MGWFATSTGVCSVPGLGFASVSGVGGIVCMGGSRKGAMAFVRSANLPNKNSPFSPVHHIPNQPKTSVDQASQCPRLQLGYDRTFPNAEFPLLPFCRTRTQDHDS